MNRTIKDAAEFMGVSKTAIRKYMTPEFREQYTEVDSSGRIIISQNGFKILMEIIGKNANKFPQSPVHYAQTNANQFPQNTENQTQTTESQPKTSANSEHLDEIVQNRLYEMLEKELQAKNEQIAAQQAEIVNLQAELSAERQHSREQAEKLAVLADQSQQLQLAQMAPLQLDQGGTSSSGEEPEGKEKRSIWRRIFG